MRKSLLTFSFPTFLRIPAPLLVAFLLTSISNSFGQCELTFDSVAEDISINCGETAPGFSSCTASNFCCPGPVNVSTFTSETGSVLHECIITTSVGPGPDWAIWLPMLDAPSANWHFVGEGHLEVYNDGTGHLWGIVVNEGDVNLQLEVDMWLHNGSNWTDWSGLGRGYKNDLGLAGNNYLDWMYYELVPDFANLSGVGQLEGSNLELHHQPSDFYYGFQMGIAANNRNSNNGFSGWFTYDGEYAGESVEGHGDVNVDNDCNDGNPECASTATTQVCRAEDGCGNVIYQSSSISVVDNTPPVVAPYDLIITIDCDAADQSYITATDDCSTFSITYTDEIIAPGCGGQIIRHYTVSDACGNAVMVDQTINLLGEGVPEFTIFPEDISISCDEVDALEEPEVEWIAGCTNTQISSVDNIIPGSCPGNYIIERTFTLTDACGNSVSQVWTITVSDTTAPVLYDVPVGITISCGTEIPPALPFALDNCDTEVLISLEAMTVAESCGYSFIRTWTATDNCGNTSSASQLIHVSDAIDPIFTFIPPSVVVNCDEPFELELALVYDECSNVELFWVDVPLGDCAGSYMRLWRAFDGCGNQALESTIVTLIDQTAPVMTVFPEDITVNCGEVPLVDPNSIQYNDNCGSVVKTYAETIEQGDCANSYTLLRTWTLTDDCGNASSWTWTITVIDNQAPTLIGIPEDVSINCGDQVSEAVVVAIDNCDTEVMVSLEASTEPTDCGYLFIRTWTGTDACGNTATGSQTITVNDQQDPEFTFVPADISISCGGEISFDDLEMATATDDCSDVTVTFEDTPVGGNCGDGIIRVFTAIDGCGNSVTAEQVITFSDNESPVFTFVPENISAECGSEVTIADAVATDDCSSPVVTFVDTPGQGCAGSFIRTYTATDLCGNQATAIMTVTFNDEEAPVVISQPLDVEVNCDAVPSIEEAGIEYSDNCGAVNVTFDEDIFPSQDCPGSYEIARTWLLIDDCGNRTDVEWNIFVTDNSAPTLVGVPEDATLTCGDQIPDAVVVAIDNCDTEVLVSLNATTVQSACGYEFLRTWTATDACGNTVSETQIIVVTDNNPPVFTFIPPDLNLNCDSGGNPDLEMAEAIDDCSEVTISFEDEIGSGGCSGGFIRHWIATDGCGNSVTVDQSITVNDQSPPVITLFPVDATVSCSDVPTVESAIVEFTDDCGNVISQFDEVLIPGQCPNSYQLLRTWTFTDACGNSTAATWTLYVVDEESPIVFGVPEDMTIGCGDPVDDAVISAIDNCSSPENITISLTAQTTQTDCGYLFIREWTVIDECGNATVVAQEITVEDSEAPVFTFVPADIVATCDQEIILTEATAEDDCSELIITEQTVDLNNGNCATSYQRIFTATDGCGNTVTATQNIIITDIEAPVTVNTPPQFVTVSCDEDYFVDENFVSFTDNCSAVSILFEQQTYPDVCSGSYSIVYSWTASDDCGNSTLEFMEVFYVDNTPPVLSGLPDDLFLECGDIIPEPTVTATDNCSELTLDYSDDFLDSDCGYQLVRTFVATDECGNSVSYAQLITFSDTTPPSFQGLPEDLFISCDDIVPAVVLPVAIDVCAGEVVVTVSSDEIPGNCPSNYSIVRTYTASDACGNEVTYAQTIFVEDNTAPDFFNFVPQLTVSCSQSNGVFVSAFDNCSTLSVTYSDVVTGTNCGGGLLRTYTAVDACGNTNQVDQVITLLDTSSPEFIQSSLPPATVTVDCANVPSEDDYAIEYFDDCSQVSLVLDEVMIPGDCPNSYVLERTWTITDACGNSASASSTITVEDTTPPQIIGVPTDITIDCSESIPAVTVVAFDNCTAEPSISLFATTEVIGCTSYFTRRWTAMDECGNLSQEIQVITITDLFNPVLSEYPADLALDCGDEVPPAPIITATDNCDNNVTVDFTETGDNGNCNTITRTWCATDCSGHTECHTQNITFIIPGQNGAQLEARQYSSSHALIKATANSEGRWGIDIYDINGRRVTSLFVGEMQQGESRQIDLDIAGLGGSMYVARFTNGNEIVSKSFVIIR